MQWAIEKRRSTLNYRRELIRSWRDAIEQFDHELDGFGDTAVYSAIRPHLSDEVRKKLESSRILYVGEGRGEQIKKHMVLDEVARIEKVWDLV